MAILKGRDLMVFIGGTSIGYATSHSLEITSDMTEISHKDVQHDWKSATVQKKSWTASSENFYSLDTDHGNTFQDMLAAQNNETVLDLVFGIKGPEGAPYSPGTTIMSGNAIITSLSLNAADGENATFTVQFQGVGPLVVGASKTHSEAVNKTTKSILKSSEISSANEKV